MNKLSYVLFNHLKISYSPEKIEELLYDFAKNTFFDTSVHIYKSRYVGHEIDEKLNSKYQLTYIVVSGTKLHYFSSPFTST